MLSRSLALGRTMMRTSVRVAPGVSVIRGGAAHDDHHHEDETVMPPYYRLPRAQRALHEQDDLIWNDGVAPETALDFDAPHYSTTKSVLMFLGGFVFFGMIYGISYYTDPAASKPCEARRLPKEEMDLAYGGLNVKGKYNE